MTTLASSIVDDFAGSGALSATWQNYGSSTSPARVAGKLSFTGNGSSENGVESVVTDVEFDELRVEMDAACPADVYTMCAGTFPITLKWLGGGSWGWGQAILGLIANYSSLGTFSPGHNHAKAWVDGDTVRFETSPDGTPGSWTELDNEPLASFSTTDLQLRFAVPASAGTSTFTVETVGAPGGGEDPVDIAKLLLNLGALDMYRTIRKNEASAERRRIRMIILDDAGDPWTGSVAGVKAQLSVNGGAETESPADIVRIAGGAHYVTPTQAYVDINVFDVITARVPAAAGRREAYGTGEIIPADSGEPALTAPAIAKENYKATNHITEGYSATKNVGDNTVTHTMPGEDPVDVPAVFDPTSPGVSSSGVAV